MIADKVKNLRKNMGLSQIQFCKLCNMPRATLYNIENGVTTNLCLKQICAICKGCNITPNDLIPEELYK